MSISVKGMSFVKRVICALIYVCACASERASACFWSVYQIMTYMLMILNLHFMAALTKYD